MDSAFAWLSSIMEWFGRLCPQWKIVATPYGAVKFVGGSRVVPLGPGVHWYWPARTELVVYPTARQTTKLPGQTLVTKDKKSVLVSGVICYEITDIAKILAYTYDPDDTIKDIAQTSLHDVCIEFEWDALHAGGRELDRRLKHTAQLALNQFGVKVIKLSVTDMAPCKLYKLVRG